MKRISLSIISVAIFLAIPAIASAQIDRSYSGCFERSNVANVATVWMKAPVCEITLTNTSNDSFYYEITVDNLNPDTYEVIDSNGKSLDPTRNDNNLTFSTVIQGSQTETFTVSPWDYDGTEDDFWFAAISDPQNQPSRPVPNPIFSDIMSQIGKLQPAFVTISGDIIKGSTSNSSVHQGELEDQSQVMEEFAGTSYPVPGDHDARQDLDTYYSAFFGSRDYTFTYGTTRFIALNTTEDYYDEGRLLPAQLTWLETTLAAATEEHLIILMQHPLSPPDWANSKGIQTSRRLEIAELFTKYGVELVIAGDVHGYDYQKINSQDIPGLQGSFYQLISGGGGGKFVTYNDTSHFFVMIHVTPTGIEHELIDYNEFGLKLTYEDQNNGTEANSQLTLENTGEVDLPYIRTNINTLQSNKLYATLLGDAFVPYESKVIDGVQRGFLEFNLDVGELASAAVSERTIIRRNILNNVNKSGSITFSSLPTVDNAQTDISVASANSKATIEVLKWDTATDRRVWTEASKKYGKLQYKIDGLEANRLYEVYVNKKLKKKKSTDSGGVLIFTNKSKQSTKKYSIRKADKLSTYISAAPASSGGPNIVSFKNDINKVSNFFAYDSALRHGYTLHQADLNNDGEKEIITVPTAGIAGHVRVFEKNGTPITSIFPFGKSFTGGISLASGDVNGDGKTDLVVAPESDRVSNVKVYVLKNGILNLLDSKRAFSEKYLGGVTVNVADINNDRDDDIIVARNRGKSKFKVLKWKPKKKILGSWLSKTAFSGANKNKGLVAAAGDVNFNGQSEIILGSHYGTGRIKAYKYNKQKNSLKVLSSYAAFPALQSGGVNLLVGNINKSKKDEIIVSANSSPYSTGQIGVLEFSKISNVIKPVDYFTPFESSYRGGLSQALADIDNDDKLELAVAHQTGNSQLRIFKKRKTGMQKISRYFVYDTAYNNGLHLAK